MYMKKEIKIGENKMAKKKSRFYIEYGKNKRKCSECKYDSCEFHAESWNFKGRFIKLKHFFYCLKCSFSSTKEGFVHKSNW